MVVDTVDGGTHELAARGEANGTRVVLGGSMVRLHVAGVGPRGQTWELPEDEQGACHKHEPKE